MATYQYRSSAVNAAALKRPRSVLEQQWDQARRAVAFLHRQQITVTKVTVQRGLAKPLIYVRGHATTQALKWLEYAWGRDRHGHYRRYAAAYGGCQVIREVRDG